MSARKSISPAGIQSPSQKQKVSIYALTHTGHGDEANFTHLEATKSPNAISDKEVLEYAEVLYKCTLCRTLPFILTSKGNFVRHMESQHFNNSDNINSCKNCTLKFRSEMDLILHVNSSHPGLEVNTNGSQDVNSGCGRRRTKMNGISSTEINNEGENVQQQESLSTSEKRGSIHQTDTIQQIVIKTDSSKDTDNTNEHLPNDCVDVNVQLLNPVHKHKYQDMLKGNQCNTPEFASKLNFTSTVHVQRNQDNPSPNNPTVTEHNPSEVLECKTISRAMNSSDNVVSQETTVDTGDNRQPRSLNDRQYGAESNHETSAECLSRLHELTDQILASSLCRRQRPSFGQETGTSFASPCFTKEFGKYTKLVREGGNIVYFCQACNWKSPSRPEFYLHCSLQCHASRMKILETPNETTRHKVEDGVMVSSNSTEPMCYANPVQFNNTVGENDTIACRRSSGQFRPANRLFHGGFDQSLVSQAPLNLAKKWKTHDIQNENIKDQSALSQFISDKKYDSVPKEDLTSSKRISPKREIIVGDPTGHGKDCMEEFLIGSGAGNTDHEVHRMPSPENYPIRNSIDKSKTDKVYYDQSNHVENPTPRRRRKRPTPRMVRNQNSLCDWTDMSDSNTDSDGETVATCAKKPLLLFEPPLGSGTTPSSGADENVKHDVENGEGLISTELQTEPGIDKCSSVILNSRECCEANVCLAVPSKYDREGQNGNVTGTCTPQEQIRCFTDLSPKGIFPEQDCKTPEDLTPLTKTHIARNSCYYIPDNTAVNVKTTIKGDYTSSNNTTFNMESSEEHCMGHNSSRQCGNYGEEYMNGNGDEYIHGNIYESIHDNSKESDVDVGDSAIDSDGLKLANREGWKISQIKDILSDFVSESSNGNISRDGLLIKVSHALNCPDAVNWGPACNRAVREEFPVSIAQRKGKYKNYFFGVQFVEDSCRPIPREVLDGDTFSLHPLRDMSHDTEKILQHLPDLVFWSGDLDTGVARDELLGMLEEKISDSNVMVWGIECNRAVRRLYPRVHTRRRGKYKTTVFYGLSYRPHVKDDRKNVKCINRTSTEFLEATPDVYHSITNCDDMVIPLTSKTAPEYHHDNHSGKQVQNGTTESVPDKMLIN